MKNIDLSELLKISAEAWNFEQRLARSLGLCRVHKGLPTARSSVTCRITDKVQANTVIMARMASQGYVPMQIHTDEVFYFKEDNVRDICAGIISITLNSSTVSVVAYGDAGETEPIVAWFEETFTKRGSLVTTVNEIRPDGSISTSSAYLDTAGSNVAHQCFYPNMGIALNDYFDAFMAAPEPVLVLFGPPGTGKSTFLRSLISSKNHEAMLAYNAQVVENPRLLTVFYESTAKILAYEDIDNHLSDRADGNMLMSSLLNATEGVVKRPNRKIIFSTNLPSIDRIDPALLRAGRCFDIMHFDNLKVAEAYNVIDTLKLPSRDLSGKSSYSLSEVLNPPNNATQKINRFGRKAGF